MTLKLTYEHQLTCGVIQHDAIISHLRGVLNTYVNKPEFKLMCPIYEESNPTANIAFHALERDTINALRKGIVNPSDASKSMRCANDATGSLPKNWL